MSVESGHAVAQAMPQRNSSEARQEMEHSLADGQTCPTLQGQPTQLFSTSMPPRLGGDTDVNQWYGQLSNWFTSQRTMRANVLPLVPSAWLPPQCHSSLDLNSDARSSGPHADFDKKDKNWVWDKPLDGVPHDQAPNATASTCGCSAGSSQCNCDSGACQEEQCNGAVDAGRSVRDPETEAGDHLVTDSQPQHTSMFLHKACRSVSEEGRSQSAGAGASIDDIWSMLACSDQKARDPELTRPPPSRKTTRLHAQDRQRKTMGVVIEQKMRKCSDLSLALSWLENMMVQPINSVHSVAPPKETHVPKKETAGVRLYVPERIQERHRPADAVGKSRIVSRGTCNEDANVKWTASSVGQGFLQ